jgi:hypothetical protein
MILGFWSGRRILFIYEVVLAAALVGVVYSIFISLIAINSFKETNNSLKAGNIPSYTSTEQYFANKFNAFFFGAAYGTCSGKYY